MLTDTVFPQQLVEFHGPVRRSLAGEFGGQGFVPALEVAVLQVAGHFEAVVGLVAEDAEGCVQCWYPLG